MRISNVYDDRLRVRLYLYRRPESIDRKISPIPRLAGEL